MKKNPLNSSSAKPIGWLLHCINQLWTRPTLETRQQHYHFIYCLSFNSISADMECSYGVWASLLLFGRFVDSRGCLFSRFIFVPDSHCESRTRQKRNNTSNKSVQFVNGATTAARTTAAVTVTRKICGSCTKVRFIACCRAVIRLCYWIESTVTMYEHSLFFFFLERKYRFLWEF